VVCASRQVYAVGWGETSSATPHQAPVSRPSSSPVEARYRQRCPD
jgi:hypothetical protein